MGQTLRHDRQQGAEIDILLERESQGQMESDVIKVATSFAFNGEESALDQFAHNSLGPPLGNVQGSRNVAKANASIASDQ